MPQWALGEKVGVKQSQISKFETGAKIPSPSMQRRIAAALGVTVDDLTEPAGETGTEVR